MNAYTLVTAVRLSSRTKTFFSNLSDQNCSSVQYSADLTKFSDQVDTLVFAKNRNALICFCLVMTINLIKVLLSLRSKKKKNGGKNNKVGVVQDVKKVKEKKKDISESRLDMV